MSAASPEVDDRHDAIVVGVVKHDYIARAVAAHPRCRLVAVTDDPGSPEWVHARNQSFADEFGIPYRRDLEAALADSGATFAVVSPEAERHCDLAVRAARAGLHVIVDKPLSNRLSECDRLVEALEGRGLRSLLWNRNGLPALRQARRVVASGRLGPLRAVHCDFYFSKDAGPPKTGDTPGDPPIDWLTRQREAHADGSDGGVGVEPMGELAIEGIYPLAYLRMLCPAPVERVFARTASHFHQAYVDNGIDDLATVTLHLAGGGVASLCLGRIGAASHPDIGEIKLHLVGEKASLVVNEPRPEVFTYHRGQPAAEYRHERVGNENDFLLVEDFLAAVESGGETLLDVPAGRDIAAVVAAAIASGRSGRAEEVPPRP